MRTYDRITPEGTRDLLFEECRARRLVEEQLQGMFEGWGYREVMTPALEFYDVFRGSAEYFPQESMYKLVDNQGRLLVMRPDMTIPIARLVGTKLQNHELPLRLYYRQQVYRMALAQNGGSHEIMQMGLELLGAGEGRADLEILAMGANVLKGFVSTGYRLELGHVGIFKVLMDNLEATREQKDEIQKLVESKNYGALGDLLGRFPESREVAYLLALPRLFGGGEIFARGKALFAGYDERVVAAIGDLEAIYGELVSLGLGDVVIVDFGLINRAEYYSGLVFRGYIEGAGAPVLSGGRYDGLLADFGGGMLAIGLGVEVDLIVAQMRHEGAVEAGCLVVAEAGFTAKGLQVMADLVARGERCEYGLVETLLEARDYACTRGIKWLYMVGDEVEKLEVDHA